MRHIIRKILVFAAVIAFLMPVTSSSSKEKAMLMIDIKQLSRYDENRVMYQQFEKIHDENSNEYEYTDNSFAALMVIKDKKVLFIEDGYDNPEEVKNNRVTYELGKQAIPDLWVNKISGSPNFIIITDRKIELQKSSSKDYVSANYKDFYLNVRDKVLKKHVAIFLSLIVNRKEAEISISRERISRKISDTGPVKYLTRVTGRTPDGGTIYSAEDANGDGITETFTVDCNDGFEWGFNSGPNLVCIINNSQKDVEKIIGRIAYLAYNGSPEEEQIIKKTFPTPEKVKAMIDELYNIDGDTARLLKSNNINLEDAVDKASKTEVKSDTKSETK